MQTFEAALITSSSARPVRQLKHWYLVVHSRGTFSVKCERCQARFFLDERLSKSSCCRPKFSLCCGDRKVTMWPIPEPPEPLANLLASSATNCRQFRCDIRKYICALCLASLHERVHKPMKPTFPAVRQCSKSRAKCIGSLNHCVKLKNRSRIASGSPIRCTDIGIA